jgi:hypothetical protein
MQIQKFPEIRIQFRAKRLEARCVTQSFLLRPNANIRCALAEADQLIHISVQEIEFRMQVGFHRRHSSIGANTDGQNARLRRHSEEKWCLL